MPSAVVPKRPLELPAGLTRRELEVLLALVLGHSNQAIADDLGISAKTVDHHVQHVYQKAGVEPHRHVMEIRGYEGLEVGQELKADVFAEGDLVDVTSTSKGKGFQGLVKRHRFSRGPETHGSMNVRQPGSIGATDAARVFKGVKMAGQMGNERTTVQGLEVLRVDAERNLLLVHGGVPGAKGSVVLVRGSVKQKVKK